LILRFRHVRHPVFVLFRADLAASELPACVLPASRPSDAPSLSCLKAPIM
jgi:hypothetical protein